MPRAATSGGARDTVGPELIGEIFGGSRVDLGGGETIILARAWAPGLVVAEMLDAIGPVVAGHEVNVRRSAEQCRPGRRVLDDDTFRDQAKAAAAENDARLRPADVIKEITEIRGLGMTGLGMTAGQARGGSE
jgi:hypothetical protein